MSSSLLALLASLLLLASCVEGGELRLLVGVASTLGRMVASQMMHGDEVTGLARGACAEGVGVGGCFGDVCVHRGVRLGRVATQLMASIVADYS
jgi:hypothetical protein